MLPRFLRKLQLPRSRRTARRRQSWHDRRRGAAHVDLLEERVLLSTTNLLAGLSAEPVEISGGAALSTLAVPVQESTSTLEAGTVEPGAPALRTTIEGINFDEDAQNDGFYHIPPDPHGAAGPNHVVSVVNTSIEWHTKTGTQEQSTALKNFFSPLNPINSTFDPKVIYDQYENRFIVVTLERDDSAQTSRILIAVSDDSDPNGTWRFHAVDSAINIDGATTWADYPGLAVDDEAIYITNNMFTFGSFRQFRGVRLWIVAKGTSGGFYAGGAATVTVHDPYAAGGIETTTQPVHTFGAGPTGIGTWLVSYSGLSEDHSLGSGGGREFIGVVQVENPLTTPTFRYNQVSLGNVEDARAAMPDAPQSGTTVRIETNDRRALNAVWRGDSLYLATTIVPASGADANQATAYWVRLDTSSTAAGSPSYTVAEQGAIGGEDIATDTYTFFPSIAVDKDGNVGIGFAASAATIFPGAYYTGRQAADPAGTVHASEVLAAGVDYYVRTFGGGRNRWGDYTGTVVDPSDDSTFWAFNEYALERGTVINSEDGRWGTRWGSFTFSDTVIEPGLTLSVSPSSVAENAGPGAATGTVSRTGDLSSSLTVTLTSSDTTEAVVPSSVVIPAGESSATFQIDAVDDDLLDGTQTVTITASATIGDTTVGVDTSFGTDGFVATALARRWSGAFPDIVVLPDGKMLAVGEDPAGDDRVFKITRVTSDGQIDSSFGSSGVVTSQFPDSTQFSPTGIALQEDGKFLVLGRADGGTFAATDLGLARYNADGSLDTAFGSNGFVRLESSTSHVLMQEVKLLSDGRILVAGIYDSDFAVVRLNSDGTLDTSFAGDGIAQADFFGSEELAYGMALQGDGKIVLAGYADNADRTGRFFAAARFNADGTLDTSFSGDGKETVDFAYRSQTATGVAVQADGRIVLTGTVVDGSTFDGDWAAVRLLSDGTLDTSFSADGKDVVDLAGRDDHANDMILQADGKIVLAGSAGVGHLSGELSGTGFALALVRYNPDGTRDATFDDDGILLLPPRPSVFEEIWGVDLQDDGKLVAITGHSDVLEVTRVNMGGTVVTATATLDVTDNESANSPPVANDDSYSVDEDSTLVVSGGFTPPNDLLLRYGFDESSSGADPALDTGITPATNGTFVDQATRTGNTPAGASLGALDLTAGSNDYVTAGDVDEFDNLTEMTITLWINLQGTPGDGDRLLTDRPTDFGPAGAKGWELGITRNFDDQSLSADRFALQFGVYESFGTSASTQSQTINGFSADQAWTFVAVTYDRTILNGEDSGLVRFWSGGVVSSVSQQGIDSLFSMFLGGPNDGDLRIGGRPDQPSTDRTPPAWLDDIRIYNRPLTQQELDAVRQEGVVAQTAAGVLANDTDPDGDPLTAVLVKGPANGTVTLNSDGTFTYTPNPDFNGTDSFTYKANDGALDSNVATVTITVNAVNDAPVANDDSYSTVQDTALTVAAAGVLANDTDVDGDALTAVLVAGPADGTLTLNTDGSFTYTPNANFTGTDSFTYKANDGTADSDVATVTITVDPPEIGGDPPSVNFGFALGLGDPALTGSAGRDWGYDVASDNYRNVYVTGLFSGTVDFDPSAGTFNLTSAGGTDIFVAKYDVTGALVWARRMGGTLNDRGASIEVDADGNVYVAGEFISATAEFGSVTLNNTTTDGHSDGFVARLDNAGDVLWARTLGDSRSDAANDIATDLDGNVYVAGLLDVSAFVQKMDASGNVTWQRILSGSSLAFANAKGISVDGSGNVYTTGDFRDTVDFDPDSVNTFNLTSAGSEDVFVSKLDSSGAFVWARRIGGSAGADRGNAIAVDGAGNAYMTGSFRGTVDFDPGAGTFDLATSGPSDVDAFVLKLDAAGSFSWAGRMGGSVFDDTGRGIALDANGNVYTTGSFSIEADFDPDPNRTFIQAGAITEGGGAFDVYVSKLDADGRFVWVRTVGGLEDDLGFGIAVSRSGDVYTTGVFGQTVDFDPAVDSTFELTAPSWPHAFVSRLFETGPNPLLTLTLDRGYVFETDGSGAAIGTVTRRNADLSSALVVTLSSSDTSEAAVPATVTIEAGQASATFLADAVDDLLADGVQGVILAARAEGLESAGTLLNVLDVNEAPVAEDDSATTDEDTSVTVSVLANDSDVNGDPLTVTAVGAPQNGNAVLNADGTITYTPKADFNGTDSFTYTISDGNGGTATATVTITVNAVNDAPVAADDSYATDEDTTLTIAAAGVLGNDSDVEGDSLTAVLVSGPANGTLTLNTDGSFTYTPDANFNGTDSFTYKANDGALDSNTATVTITVNAVNDAPVAVDDSYSTDEDTALTIAAAGVLTNDTDVEGDALTATLVTGPSNGTLTLNTDGSFTYTPNANFNGTDSFTYKANDGSADSNTATVTITVNAVNDAPVAVDDSYSTDEDTALTVAAAGVLTNDTDVEGDALTAAVVTGPSNGTLTLNADGSFTYTPDADFNGTDSFTYKANDGTADSNTATVTITVNAVNDAPVAVDDSYSTDEDIALTVTAAGVLTNDTDVDGDALTAALVTGPTNGTLTLNTDGSFTYTPDADFNGTDRFTYKANDGALDSNTATVTITVAAVNDAPAAVDDSYSTDEDTALTIAAAGVLTNDTDVEGDALTAAVVTGPANGTLTLNTDGSFTYTPNANFNGTDSFTYRANDGTADSNEATVTITVNAVNDAPVAADDSYSTDEDTELVVAAAGVLGNDADVDGDALTAILVSAPTNGTLTLSANGSFTYTPDANFNGTDSFTYKANDGSVDSNTATVTITVTAVNDAPVAVDDSYSTDEDVALTISAAGVLTNDTDVEGDALTAAVVTGPANGALTLNADGSFTYTPNANFNGTDSFTYKANDGTTDSNTATVTITVNAVNDAPVAVDDSYSTDEDMALTIAAAGVLTNDTDVEGDALSAVLVAGPANGSLTLNSDGSFTYTPDANFNGTDSFTYKANDGTVDSSTATVTITVNAVNDAPVAVDDAYGSDEDEPLTITAPGLLVNDTDVEGDALTAVLISGPSNGTLTLEADGSFIYTPDADFNGTDSFTYKANDGSADSNEATVTITVTAVNDAPVAADDLYRTIEDTELTVAAPGVLANDGDVDGDSLTAVLVTGPTSGTLTLNADGSFTYTPNADFNGTDSFTYKANDGALDSNAATVTIAVGTVNDAPTAADDAYTTNEDTVLDVPAAGVLANDGDVDGDSLTALLVDGPSSGTLTLSADGSFTYTPNADFNGTDSFTYKANDGTTDSNTATVTITVTAVNDPPQAADDAYSTDEDTALNIPATGVLANDSDVDGDPLTAVLVGGPSSGTLTLNSDGSFTYTPNAEFNGTDSFTYLANDGELDSNTATVTITVGAVNDAPVALDDAYSTDEDTALDIPAAGVLVNDSDVDGDSLSAVLVAGPSNGTLTLNADGSFTYTPNANFNGVDSFAYKANDGSADSNEATVTITINAVNDAPVAVDDSYSTDEDVALVVPAAGVLLNDTDVEGDALSAVLVSGPSNGTLTLNADGSFTYTPNGNFNGTDSFTYRANDGAADSNTAIVTITVNAVNDAPVASDDAYSTDEDTALTVAAAGVLANDSDVDGDSLSALLVSGPANGTLTLGADGSFTYTPDEHFNGTDSFTYKASDGAADSNDATVTITVNAVNDAPVAVDDSYSTDEDMPLTVAAAGVLANDTDVDGDALAAVLVSGPSHGTLTLNSDGSFSYTPNADFNGTDTFTYKADDGRADSAAATVTITVTPVNDAPVAADDEYTTREGTPLEVAAPGVMANDLDVDGDALTAALVSGPSNGTLSFNSDGSFTYTPAAQFSGTDSFTYGVSDGTAESNTATVWITVSPLNDAPVAGDDTWAVDEDSVLTVAAPGVLANDSDPEADPLTAALVAGPSNGTLTLNADGSFTYTPDADFNGTDSFTYRANDGNAESNLATVTITVNPVNDAPVASDATLRLDENSPNGTVVGTVLATDVDSATLTYSLVAAGDSALFAIDAATGEITVADYGSLDFEVRTEFTLTVQVQDDGDPALSDTATITIRLNDLPEIDIEPGDDSNTINLQRGRPIHVAILSTESFDATTQLDLLSLRFGRNGDEDSLVAHPQQGVRTKIEDVNGDGRLDVIVYADADLTGLQPSDTHAVLTGRRSDGTAFVARQAVQVRASKGQGKKGGSQTTALAASEPELTTASGSDPLIDWYWSGLWSETEETSRPSRGRAGANLQALDAFFETAAGEESLWLHLV